MLAKFSSAILSRASVLDPFTSSNKFYFLWSGGFGKADEFKLAAIFLSGNLICLRGIIFFPLRLEFLSLLIV
jgi:hypothetical protein